MVLGDGSRDLQWSCAIVVVIFSGSGRCAHVRVRSAHVRARMLVHGTAPVRARTFACARAHVSGTANVRAHVSGPVRPC